MYKIAICDDHIPFSSELEQLLLHYGTNNNIAFEISVFYSGEKLLKSLTYGNEYHMIFLDICLKEESGIDIGMKIRANSTHSDTYLTYVSTHDEYFFQLFKLKPFDFLLKPISLQSLSSVLDDFFKMIEQKKLFFLYQKQPELHRIPFKKILYFYSNNKKIFMVTADNVTDFWGKLPEVQRQTPRYFFCIHKSYLINYDFVSKYTYESVTMLNGDILGISKGKRTQVRTYIMQLAKENERCPSIRSHT